MQLSIIIPMYNVAPYVERCIRSLEDQDIQIDNYEIICINDGSPDNCREIVEQLQQEYFNIVLINQENQGVSRARNNGIEKATGKYLLFVDPDDYVDSNSFARVLKAAKCFNSQVHFLGFSFLNENGRLKDAIINKEHNGILYDGIEAFYLARSNRHVDPDRMCAILFDREFILENNLRYLPNVPYLEDGELLARIMCLAERCTFDGYSFYQRTSRPGSATKSDLFYAPKATNGFVKSAKNLKDFQASDDLTKIQKEFLNQPICKFILLALNSCTGFKTIKRLRVLRITLNKLGLKKCNLKGCDPSYQVQGYSYNISIYLGAIAVVWVERIIQYKWNLRKKYF